MDRQHYRWAFFITVFLLASVYFYIFSESGLLERIGLDREKIAISDQIDALKSENKELRRLLDRYRNGEHPDGEIADSGYVKNGSSVLIFRDTGKNPAPVKASGGAAVRFPVPLLYIRIGWITISALVILGLILFGRKLSEHNR